MQLDEMVEEYGIVAIAKKTRISVENIEKLLRKDFSTLNRVKTLGFISIIEREFNLDLSQLRQECNDYFPEKQKTQSVDRKSVVKVSASRAKSKKSPMFTIVSTLIIVAIAVASWYYLSGDKLNYSFKNSSSVTENDKNVTVKKKKKKWTSRVKPKKKPKKKVADKPIPVFVGNEKNNSKKNSAKGKLSEEDKIISEIKKKTQEKITKKNSANTAVNYDDMPAIEPVKIAKSNKVAKSQKETIKKQKNTAPKTAVLHPAKKLWIGYTNLDTMQRATRVTESDVEFAPNKKGWIVVTGHSGLNFTVGDKTITSDTKGKAYFLITQGSVKQISQEEFQKLNKSTVW